MSTWVKLRNEMKDLEREVKLMRVVLAQKEAYLESMSKILEEHRETPTRAPRGAEQAQLSDDPGEWLSATRNIQAQIISGTLDEKIVRFLNERQEKAWNTKDIASEIGEDPNEVSSAMSRLYYIGMVRRRKERGQDGARVYHYRPRADDAQEAPVQARRRVLVDDF